MKRFKEVLLLAVVSSLAHNAGGGVLLVYFVTVCASIVYPVLSWLGKAKDGQGLAVMVLWSVSILLLSAGYYYGRPERPTQREGS